MGPLVLRPRALGLTLAEILVALGLLTCLTMSVLGLFLSARTVGAKGEGSVRAVNLAEFELDRWKTSDFATLETLTSAPQNYQRDYLGQAYQVTASASRLSSTPGVPEYDVLQLVIALEWQEKKQMTLADQDQGTIGQSTTRMEIQTMVSAVGAI